MEWPIIYKPNESSTFPVVHFQCKAGIHFNPVLDTRRKDVQIAVIQKYLNYCISHNAGNSDYISCVSNYESESDSEAVICHGFSNPAFIHVLSLLLVQPRFYP